MTGGPPGAKALGELLLPGPLGPPDPADKATAAARSCAVNNSELDLGSERLRDPAGTASVDCAGSGGLRDPAGTASVDCAGSECLRDPAGTASVDCAGAVVGALALVSLALAGATARSNELDLGSVRLRGAAGTASADCAGAVAGE